MADEERVAANGAAAAEVVDDLLLDLTAKKKKKKKATKGDGEEDAAGAGAGPDGSAPAATEVGADDAAAGGAAAEEDASALFADLKKKKKKKKATDVDASEAVAGAEETPTEDAKEASSTWERQLLGELKKKRKEKLDFAAFVEQLGDLELGDGGDEAGEELDLSKAKKKKKARFAADAGASAEAADGADGAGDDDEDGGDDDEDNEHDEKFMAEATATDDGGITYEEDKVLNETWLGSDRDYTYRELLDRAFYFIQKNNPDMAGERRKYTMIPPQLLREGTKKTVFVNLSDMCKRMRRQPEHVMQFLFAELGTSGSVDGSGRLIIKGRFQQKQIESVLRSYILEYVTCKVCRRPDTVLTKENRLMFVQCQQCRANYSVSSIKTGFSAQIGRRKR